MPTKTILFAFSIIALSWIALDPIFDQTVAALESFHQNFPQEKIYLHHDKPYYVLGEDLWFALHCAHAIDHSNITPSGLIYVEIADPDNQIVASRNIKVLNGTGRGDIKLDPNWKKTGTYTFRAFSNYQRNFEPDFFFKKEISVYDSYQTVVKNQQSMTDSSTTVNADLSNASQEFDVQFFPEGGDLVQGLSSVIAVKATNKDGTGLAVKGKIWDQNEKLITLFITNERGLGSFSLTPAIDMRYRAEIIDASPEKSIVLPLARNIGHALSIKTNLADTLIIIAKSTLPTGLQNAFLIGHQRGKILVANQMVENPSQIFMVPTKEFPTGILHFTLFDKAGMPVAERLTFNRNLSAEPEINLDLNNEKYDSRSKVKVNLQTKDRQGNKIEGQASIAVYDQLLATRPMYDLDIRSFFWLQSDLRGRVVDPSYYFAQNDARHRKDLNLLLMTQGWRRFNWDVMRGEKNFALKYLPENGFTIKGKTTRFLNENKGRTGEVFLSGMGKTFEMIHTQSDEDGYFTFTDLQIRDTAAFVLQGNREMENGKKKQKGLAPSDKNRLNLEVFEDTLAWSNSNRSIRAIKAEHNILQQFLSESRYNRVVDDAYANLWSIDLEEIVITEKRVVTDVFYHQKSMLYKEPDTRIMMDEVPGIAGRTNIFDAINGKIAGVEVIGTFPNKTVRIRGINSISQNTTATILIDGAVVSEATANTFPVDRIAFVDVLKGIRTSAIYGSSTGVFAIYTKSVSRVGTNRASLSGMLNFEHPGYYRAREFYSPVYGAKSNEGPPDYRSTLYWNPNVSLTGKGSEVEFFTADRSSIYEIRVEGMTSDGSPVVVTATFEVE